MECPMCTFCDCRKDYCPITVCTMITPLLRSLFILMFINAASCRTKGRYRILLLCIVPHRHDPRRGYIVFDLRDSNHMSNNRVTRTKSEYFFGFSSRIIEYHPWPQASIIPQICSARTTRLSLNNIYILSRNTCAILIVKFFRKLCGS